METGVVNLRLAIVTMIISTINNMTVIKIIDRRVVVNLRKMTDAAQEDQNGNQDRVPENHGGAIGHVVQTWS